MTPSPETALTPAPPHPPLPSHPLPSPATTAEADYHECRPAAVAPVDLSDYEILVDLGDHKWGFTLQPATNDGRRVWHLRATSEAQRYEWSRRLVLATLTGN